jgi:manganese transport protein
MDAYHLLPKILGASMASIFFGIALLASGQNSTLTGTLAGQIVMEGFLNIKLKPWLRRLVTRMIAIIPAFIMTAFYGESGMMNLLVFSQVVLSFQLSFAVFPLVAFTSSKEKMGNFANKAWLKYSAWSIAIFIAALNVYLVITTLSVA